MRVRSLVVGALAAVAAVALAGCDILPIPGAGPLRYRDEVFDEVTRTDDITYGTALDKDGQPVTLALDLYEPAGDGAEARPLIIWVHGGSFCCGNKNSPEIVDQATLFARKGYVTASISYRLSRPGCTVVGADCVRAIVDARADAQEAVRYLRAHAAEHRIDPDRIAMAGTSAGAITALGVNFATEDPAAKIQAAVSLSGALINNDQVDLSDGRALLMHGTADTLVPYAWARDTWRAVHRLGVPSHLITWEGAGHVPYVEYREAILEATQNFLYRNLDAANADQWKPR